MHRFFDPSRSATLRALRTFVRPIALSSIACLGLPATAALTAQTGPPAERAGAEDEEAAVREREMLGSDLAAFRAWLGDYATGAVRMMRDLEVDEAALAAADHRMAALAAWNDRAAAELLFEAARIEPRAPGALSASDNLDFQSELLPWRIRAIARDRLATMSAAGLDEWLLDQVEAAARGRRRDDAAELGARADAALRVLGARGGPAFDDALERVTGNFPPELRVRAVAVLAEHATLESVDTFFDLLRDRQPEIRITAARGIAAALAPHTDEVANDEIPAEVADLREKALKKLGRLLERDKVWQVRAAAAESLAEMRTKHAIPVLIDGYEEELDREKEPWAMDVRLHRLLVGLTGQSIPVGDAKPWQRFWKAEGAGMQLVSAERDAALAGTADDGRYADFFSIDLESDRVLFVVDFSGSMKETITLQTATTSTEAGQTTTKVGLVTQELRRIVLALPEDSYFNVIVFSDGVRIWRPGRGGYPELVELDDDARDDLLGSFLQNIEPRGPTNLHDALDTALGFAGRGLKDRHYDVGFDTIYVLSDGAPSYGPVTDKDEIRRLVREANSLRKLTIHAITFGEKNDTDFLRKLAEENGGRHVHID